VKFKAVFDIFLIVLLAIALISAVRAHRELVSLRQWKSDASKRLAENEKRLMQIKKRLKLTQSRSYILKLAREKLYMKRDDETVIPIKGLPASSGK